MPSSRRKCVRGLMTGGTLALEALQTLRPFLGPLASNLDVPGVEQLEQAGQGGERKGHTILDLWASGRSDSLT